MEMTAVDTNVIVRFLTRDDEGQFRKASALFASEVIYIPDSVWLETEWVLRHAYGYPASSINQAFRGLMGLPQVRVDDPTRLSLAVE